MSIAELKTTLNAIISGTNDSSMFNEIYESISKVINRKNTPAIKLSAAEKKAADKALLSVKKRKVSSLEKVMAKMKKKYPALIK